MAALCAEATSSVVNILAVLAGRRGRLLWGGAGAHSPTRHWNYVRRWFMSGCWPLGSWEAAVVSSNTLC